MICLPTSLSVAIFRTFQLSGTSLDPVHLLVVGLCSVDYAFSYFVSVLQNTVLILMFTGKCIKFITPYWIFRFEMYNRFFLG